MTHSTVSPMFGVGATASTGRRRTGPILKVTPTSARSSWKRKLYRDCLDQTRRARAEGGTPDRNVIASDVLRRNAIEVTPSSLGRSSGGNWRMDVADETQEQSSSRKRRPSVRFAGIVDDNDESPHDIHNSTMGHMTRSDNGTYQHEHVDSMTDSLRVAHHCITEEELFDLLTEVEHELEQEELQRNEGLIDELDRFERQCLEEQVTGFEEWQEENSRSCVSIQPPQSCVRCNVPLSTALMTNAGHCPSCGHGFHMF